MYSVYPNYGGTLEFLALELVPLGLAIQRINEINGRGRGEHSRTVLRVIDGSDDEGLDNAEGDLEGDGPVSQAVTRLRDAMRGLFNRAGENGRPLTVLSLQSDPSQPHCRTSKRPGAAPRRLFLVASTSIELITTSNYRESPNQVRSPLPALTPP
jgi:hypothetical protein